MTISIDIGGSQASAASSMEAAPRREGSITISKQDIYVSMLRSNYCQVRLAVTIEIRCD